MNEPQDPGQYVTASADALNRVLHVARIEPLGVRLHGRHVELDGHARRRIAAAILAMNDGIARTVAVSAWAVFGEVLAQHGRGEMANTVYLRVYASALTDHAHMIEGATAVQVVTTAMHDSIANAAASRSGKHRS